MFRVCAACALLVSSCSAFPLSIPGLEDKTTKDKLGCKNEHNDDDCARSQQILFSALLLFYSTSVHSRVAQATDGQHQANARKILGL